MDRYIPTFFRSEPISPPRRTIVISLPNSSDAEKAVSWSVLKVEDWLDKIANRMFYVYTTVKLLTQATKEKYQSEHMEQQSATLLSLSDLLMNAVWGWNTSMRAINGFSAKWLQFDIDQEFQDALLRSEPIMNAVEASTSRLLNSSSSWEVFMSFCVWMKDVVALLIFILVEVIHSLLLFAISVIDLILDLLLDSEKRYECATLFFNFLKWLHSQYFEAGSIVTKTALSAIKKLAPHLLAYLGRPWSYVIQVMAYIVKKLAKMAEEGDPNALPGPIRISAKAVRKILLNFRKVAFSLWKPLVTNVIVPGNADLPRSKL